MPACLVRSPTMRQINLHCSSFCSTSCHVMQDGDNLVGTSGDFMDHDHLGKLATSTRIPSMKCPAVPRRQASSCMTHQGISQKCGHRRSTGRRCALTWPAVMSKHSGLLAVPLQADLSWRRKVAGEAGILLHLSDFPPLGTWLKNGQQQCYT